MNISDKGKARETGQALNVHYRFIVWLIPTLMNFPRTQKFLLGDKIQTTAMDVLEALIEATYTKHREAPLVRANLGLEKLRFFFRISRDLRYLDYRRHEYAVRQLNEVGSRVGAWLKVHRSHERA